MVDKSIIWEVKVIQIRCEGIESSTQDLYFE
jgi:hypothetical protein